MVLTKQTVTAINMTTGTYVTPGPEMSLNKLYATQIFVSIRLFLKYNFQFILYLVFHPFKS